jgi:diketogulonate reductase-like aldo/keto reductase
LYLRTKKTGVNPTNRGGAFLSTWQKFENIVFMTLQKIAHKHEVSISSVALRWALQSGELGSIVVGTSLNAKEGDDRPFVRPAELRNIMKFMLDDEDMKELWAVSGKEEEIDPNQDPEEYHEFSNRKLWL